jgi:hypothetical protein
MTTGDAEISPRCGSRRVNQGRFANAVRVVRVEAFRRMVCPSSAAEGEDITFGLWTVTLPALRKT